MPEHVFPMAAEDVVATLAEFFQHQGRSDIVELLDNASAHLEQTDYDNWNGGTYTYGLMLDVPVPIFANVEPNLDEVEKIVSEKLSTICRGYSNDHLNSATISPLTTKATRSGLGKKPTEADVSTIWAGSHFRLFLSHVSAHKVLVADLKAQLKVRGISAFVAHEDIAPSLEWQNEIEVALKSMNALAALLTPDFHASHWTDQEIGFALGRGVLVLPVRLGADPYGFIGKVQGIAGSLKVPVHIANLISATLLSNAVTRPRMRTSVVTAFSAARSFSDAIELSKLIAKVSGFTESEKSIIRASCQQNDQVFNATGVVKRVYQAIGEEL